MSTRVKPTHFVSLRVKSKTIWDNIDKVQQKIISSDSNFDKFKIPSQDSHITIFVLTLNKKEEVENAIKTLEKTFKYLKTLEK
jgi:hypothetical protein